LNTVNTQRMKINSYHNHSTMSCGPQITCREYLSEMISIMRNRFFRNYLTVAFCLSVASMLYDTVKFSYMH